MVQVKGQYDFTVSATEGCTPLKVKFNFVTTLEADTVESYHWSFGNGDNSNERDPDSVVFEIAGVYHPTLVLNFSDNSQIEIDKPGLITVREPAKANFTYSTPTGSIYNYTFEQNSALVTSVTYDFTWDIEGFPTQRTGPVQDITFPQPGTFLVTLTVTDEFGCSGSVTKPISVLEELIIPNVFTPDNNSINDFFIIRSAGDIPLRIRIYTRTGTLVYESEGSVITWNGETASGDRLKSGIYYYSLEALRDDPNKLYTKTGFFHMYRKE